MCVLISIGDFFPSLFLCLFMLILHCYSKKNCVIDRNLNLCVDNEKLYFWFRVKWCDKKIIKIQPNIQQISITIAILSSLCTGIYRHHSLFVYMGKEMIKSFNKAKSKFFSMKPYSHQTTFRGRSWDLTLPLLCDIYSKNLKMMLHMRFKVFPSKYILFYMSYKMWFVME